MGVSATPMQAQLARIGLNPQLQDTLKLSTDPLKVRSSSAARSTNRLPRTT